MKTILMFALVTIAVTQSDDYFTTLDDDIDVNSVVTNPLKLKEFLDCFQDRGPCSDVAQSYKVNILEAVQTACKRCTEKQKLKVWEFLQGLKLMPVEYQSFKHHYDPEDKYFDALEREVAKFSNPLWQLGQILL